MERQEAGRFAGPGAEAYRRPGQERRAEIPALVACFVRQLNERFHRDVRGITPEALAALTAYDFPGNVRELENLLERATIMETKNVISVGSLPPNVTKIVTQEVLGGGQYQETFPEEGVFLDTEMDRLEKIHLMNALEKTGGNRTEAAKLLNISLRSIRYRLQKHGIE